MKKTIITLLFLATCLLLVACGGNSTIHEVEMTPEVTPEPKIPVVQLTETVSTDILDLSIEHSKLSYYIDRDFPNYGAPTDVPDSLYAAKKGSCLVSVTMKITNTDRSAINFRTTITPSDFTVTYKDEEYPLYCYHPTQGTQNVGTFHFTACDCVSKESGVIEQLYDTDWHFIDPGETHTVRLFGVIKVEPDSLNDGFNLTVRIQNSQGQSEFFTYIIPVVNTEA